MRGTSPATESVNQLLNDIEVRTNAGQSLDLAVGLEVGQRLGKHPRLGDPERIERVKSLALDRTIDRARA